MKVVVNKEPGVDSPIYAKNNTLKESDVICSQCDGVGVIGKVVKGRNGNLFKQVCTKCHGDGKLDWIENVVGKKVEQYAGQYADGSSYIDFNFT